MDICCKNMILITRVDNHDDIEKDVYAMLKSKKLKVNKSTTDKYKITRVGDDNCKNVNTMYVGGS